MEERRNEDQKTEETKKNGQKQSGFRAYVDNIPVRSCMLMALAGIYIMYLGYGLCKNVMNGVEGGGPGFMVVGIVFIVIAAGMLAIGIRGVLLDHKRQQETPETPAEEATEEAAEETAELPAEETAAESQPSEEKEEE